METSSNPELQVEWAGPGVLLLFLAVIAAISASLTFIPCRRHFARQKEPSYFISLLTSLITAFLTILVSYEDHTGSIASILSGAAVPFLIFWVVCLIPALAVVWAYRKKSALRQTPGGIDQTTT